jgi:hypothetical protein
MLSPKYQVCGQDRARLCGRLILLCVSCHRNSQNWTPIGGQFWAPIDSLEYPTLFLHERHSVRVGVKGVLTMRYLGWGALSVVIFLGLAVGASAQQSAGVICNAKSALTNIRNGPSARGSVIEAVPNDTKVTLEARVKNPEGTHDWFRIVFRSPSSGEETLGFVFNEMVASSCSNQSNSRPSATQPATRPVAISRQSSLPNEFIRNFTSRERMIEFIDNINMQNLAKTQNIGGLILGSKMPDVSATILKKGEPYTCSGIEQISYSAEFKTKHGRIEWSYGLFVTTYNGTIGIIRVNVPPLIEFKTYGLTVYERNGFQNGAEYADYDKIISEKYGTPVSNHPITGVYRTRQSHYDVATRDWFFPYSQGSRFLGQQDRRDRATAKFDGNIYIYSAYNTEDSLWFFANRSAKELRDKIRECRINEPNPLVEGFFNTFLRCPAGADCSSAERSSSPQSTSNSRTSTWHCVAEGNYLIRGGSGNQPTREAAERRALNNCDANARRPGACSILSCKQNN